MIALFISKYLDFFLQSSSPSFNIYFHECTKKKSSCIGPHTKDINTCAFQPLVLRGKGPQENHVDMIAI